MARRSSSPRSKTSRRRRAYGQHFLSNARAARRIVERFAPRPHDRILEIGPGRGALTAMLVESGAQVVAVEKDPALARGLEERIGGGTPRFELIEADILACDIRALAGDGRLRVIANLPYSITGEILTRLLLAADALSDLMLMLQKEVVDRILARPGSRTYGSLSVMVQHFTGPELVMRLGPGSFSPPPAVSSAVVAMPIRKERGLPAGSEARYLRFVQEVFGRRRRTLRNNLKGMGLLGPEAEKELAVAGLDLDLRPEAIDREEFIRLFSILSR